MGNTLVRNDEYFATLQDPIELAQAMNGKITLWRNYCQAKGLLSLWYQKLSNYYGISANGNMSQQMTPGGSEGELSMIKVNDMRTLLQEQLVLVTSQRPAGMAKAVNTDSASLKSSRIGTTIAEYYMANVGLEAKFVQATEAALLCDEAFVDLFWDKEAGDPIAVDPETQKAEMSGDVTMRVHCAWNAARDIGAKVEDQKWYILSYRANKFDLAAAYPKFSDQITYAQGDSLPAIQMDQIPDGSDQVYVHLLIHDRTAAVPDGRYALMVAEQIVLDTTLPYKDFPVERIAPADVIDGPTGYSASNDIMGLEQITDALHSIITSNNITFGAQNLIGPPASGLNIVDIAKGMRLFEMAPDMIDKLKPLTMVKTAPETYKYAEILSGKKERATGSSSGVLAAQAAQGASGSAMALIDSKSIQYNSGIQRSYYRLLSSCMTKLIGILRAYADTPRVARIVGKSKAQGLKEFKYTGQDLNSISSIVYEMVNPISQTQGGRLSMAQDLIKAGLIKDPKQYLTLVTTGNLDAFLENDANDELLILEENEWLSEGKPVQALATENPQKHIMGHMSNLSSPQAKEDPTLVNATLAHIQDHLDKWMQATQTNPGLLMALGYPPLMPPPGMGGPPGPGGPGGPSAPPPPHPPMPPGAHGPGPMVGGGEHPAVARAGDVKPPNLPMNPATGDRAQVPGAPNGPSGPLQ